MASQDTRGQGRCGRGHIEGVLLDKGTLLVAPAEPGCTDPALGNLPAPQPPAGFPASHRAIALYNTLADVLIVAVLIFSVVAGIKKVIIVPLEVGQAR